MAGPQLWKINGNNIKEIVDNVNHAKMLSAKGNPIVILMHTEMGMGVDFMMGSHKWHGIPPNDEQLGGSSQSA